MRAFVQQLLLLSANMGKIVVGYRFNNSNKIRLMATNGKCASHLHIIIITTNYTLVYQLARKWFSSPQSAKQPPHSRINASHLMQTEQRYILLLIHRDEQQNASIKLFKYRQIFRLLYWSACLPARPPIKTIIK